ncbi:aldolase [Meredithblackwellia eburnea MCA 4105]
MTTLCTKTGRVLRQSWRKVREVRTFATEAPSSDKFVTILECGIRDGLQNEKGIVPTSVKAELANKLVDAGLRYFEAGSFVSPKWVPQMADTSKLIPLLPHDDRLTYSVLTPNVRAVDDIVATGSLKYVHEVSVFSAASEGFTRANTNCTIAESIDRMAATVAKAAKLGLKARGSISCAAGSPFEQGVTDKRLVREIAKKMIEAGCSSVSLADTNGVGTPNVVKAMIEEVLKDVPASMLAIHVHDTFGSGVANVLAAVELGIRTVDSSVGGLGGCPYSPGATGNVATEDVVYALHASGYQTGVDLEKLSEIGEWISLQIGRKTSSRAGLATLSRMRRMAAKAA